MVRVFVMTPLFTNAVIRWMDQHDISFLAAGLQAIAQEQFDDLLAYWPESQKMDHHPNHLTWSAIIIGPWTLLYTRAVNTKRRRGITLQHVLHNGAPPGQIPLPRFRRHVAVTSRLMQRLVELDADTNYVRFLLFLIGAQRLHNYRLHSRHQLMQHNGTIQIFDMRFEYRMDRRNRVKIIDWTPPFDG